jgi:hypothetical protein
MAWMAEPRNVNKILVRKSGSLRWEYNIKIDCKEEVYEDGSWIELAQDYVLLWALV